MGLGLDTKNQRVSMRIFLSSTAYDLGDFRDLAVNRLTQAGHQVIHHESPLFPVQPGLHTHDQCVTMVDNCDIFICVIDRRYGGTYSGNFSHLFSPQTVTVTSGAKKVTIIYNVKDLSITWCEWIRARNIGRPIITFARQRLLDEKNTRRKNQRLLSFKPAYAEKNQLFDFLDWITHQKTFNWIIPYTSIVDFENKLLSWLSEYEKMYVPAVGAPVAPTKMQMITGAAIITTGVIPKGGGAPPEVCGTISKLLFLVEGTTDQLFVNNLLKSLPLAAESTIIPTFGKVNLLQSFVETARRSNAENFDYVAAIFDSDTTDHDDAEAQRQQLIDIVSGSGLPPVMVFPAVPSIESWILQVYGPCPDESPKELKTWTRQIMIRGKIPHISIEELVRRGVTRDLLAFLEFLRCFEKN